MHRTSAVLALALAAVAPASWASSDHAHPKAAAAASAAFAEGEVRKVDKEAGKVTIKHGPIPSLDMPPMTMVFRVKDAAMLDRLAVGQAIRFKADKVGGSYTVTELEPGR